MSAGNGNGSLVGRQDLHCHTDMSDGKLTLERVVEVARSRGVQVGSAVARDTVVLARVPDAGYVVKKVGKVTRAQLELQSLNEAFPPIVVPRDDRTIVGTVVLRWCPHMKA